MSASLRAGVIGLGTMGRHHVRVLSELPGVELVGAADPSSPPARAAVRGTANDQPDLTGLLRLGMDMCVVATPTLTHTEIGLQLAPRPACTRIDRKATGTGSAEWAPHGWQVGQKRHLVACVGHIERYNSALRSMRPRLAQGELGAVFQVATRRQGPFPQRIRDVGVIMDLATHDVDLTRWVTGSAYARVSAFTAHPQRPGT